MTHEEERDSVGSGRDGVGNDGVNVRDDKGCGTSEAFVVGGLDGKSPATLIPGMDLDAFRGEWTEQVIVGIALHLFVSFWPLERRELGVIYFFLNYGNFLPALAACLLRPFSSCLCHHVHVRLTMVRKPVDEYHSRFHRPVRLCYSITSTFGSLQEGFCSEVVTFQVFFTPGLANALAFNKHRNVWINSIPWCTA